MSNSKPDDFSSAPASRACCTPVSVRPTSVHPVKRFSRFQVDSPWRSSTRVGMDNISTKGREFYNPRPCQPDGRNRPPRAMNLMQFALDNWVLILAALTSGALLLWPTVARQGGASVGTTEAVRLINREKAVLIDVSEPEEFAQGHAAGARNVPLNSLQGAKELPSNKQLPVVLIC